ncbi:uncharacterized protein V1510DRAFT_401466 [Dipodascopsis tothii]|uniref:uncharacterized protein n=1 Tax=Dipodascopsis tothii TaxID=44089 RepID=UPI0034CDE09F
MSARHEPPPRAPARRDQPSSPPADAGPGTRQRSAIACRYCRRRKIRCSGFETNPADSRCHNCIRFNQQCVFTPVSSMVGVPPPDYTASLARGARGDMSYASPLEDPYGSRYYEERRATTPEAPRTRTLSSSSSSSSSSKSPHYSGYAQQLPAQGKMPVSPSPNVITLPPPQSVPGAYAPGYPAAGHQYAVYGDRRGSHGDRKYAYDDYEARADRAGGLLSAPYSPAPEPASPAKAPHAMAIHHLLDGHPKVAGSYQRTRSATDENMLNSLNRHGKR